MGELVGAGDITGTQDRGNVGAQERVGRQGATRRKLYAELLEPETAHVGLAPDRHQDRIEFDLDGLKVIERWWFV